ncbi:hypothetical protein N9163_00935 [bacterium]|nr:hypothetical protein [Akkermansiaceae bacterium]MDB4437394.1 hypothetical protein [bacterium]
MAGREEWAVRAGTKDIYPRLLDQAIRENSGKDARLSFSISGKFMGKYLEGFR